MSLKGCKRVGNYYHCRIESPSKFDPHSFRTIKSGKVLITIGCPRGKFKKGRCQVGTRAQKILRPVK